jgi:hypothetical protein
MFEKPNKLRSALLGGALIGVISGVPGLNLLNCCCCAGIMLGGFFAVYAYRGEFTDEMPPMESSDALILGIIAGIIGAVGASLVTGIFNLVFGPLEEKLLRGFWDKLVQRLEEQGNIPGGSVEDLRSQLDRSMAEARSFGGMLRGLVFALILYPIFGMLGALIGYGFLRKKPVAPAHPPQVQ